MGSRERVAEVRHVLRARARVAHRLAEVRDREGAALHAERLRAHRVGDVPHVEDVVRREVRRDALEGELACLEGQATG